MMSKRKTFSWEFKLEAARLLELGDKSPNVGRGVTSLKPGAKHKECIAFTLISNVLVFV